MYVWYDSHDVISWFYFVRLMLREEPPSAPPKNIVASGRTNQSIMVQWQPPPELQLNGVLRGYVLRYRINNPNGKFFHHGPYWLPSYGHFLKYLHLTEWWQNFHIWVNFPFKDVLGVNDKVGSMCTSFCEWFSLSSHML